MKNEMLTQLATVQTNCKSRLISEQDISYALDTLTAFKTFCKQHQFIFDSLTLVGGYVSNSYGYAAHTTVLHITNNDIWHISRQYATKKPHGRGALLTLRCKHTNYNSMTKHTLPLFDNINGYKYGGLVHYAF